jgi:hypothetical protein
MQKNVLIMGHYICPSVYTLKIPDERRKFDIGSLHCNFLGEFNFW